MIYGNFSYTDKLKIFSNFTPFVILANILGFFGTIAYFLGPHTDHTIIEILFGFRMPLFLTDR